MVQSMLGKKDEITSIGKEAIGSGFFDPLGSSTCNIKKVRGDSARCEYPRKRLPTSSNLVYFLKNFI
jgi:hypothetical protein